MFPRHAASRPVHGEPAASASAEVTRLIEANISYAHALAAEVVRKLPPDLERKDIEGWAELGLVEAANAFDATRGVQFKTFAYYRIRGAIYDGLRKMGWYPKAQYQQMRFEMAANEYLRDASGEPPVSGSAEAQLQDLKETTGNLMACYMLSLDNMPEEPADEKQVSAEQTVIEAEQKKNIRWVLAKLPEINRVVLEGFYFGGLTLDQIGTKLGLSRSWVCRLHAKSLAMLRKQLTEATARPATPPPPATFPGAIR
jgi:RNA polymerase sigma factor for flagellar operon FliA